MRLRWGRVFWLQRREVKRNFKNIFDKSFYFRSKDMKSRNMIKILCMASLSLTVLGGITCFGNRYAKAEETVPHNAENEWEDETLTWSLDAGNYPI